MAVETQATLPWQTPAQAPTERTSRSQTTSPSQRPEPTAYSSLRSSSLSDNLLAGIEQVLLELLGPFPPSEAHGPPFAAAGSNPLAVDMAAGADGGFAFATDVARPPAPSGDGNGTPLFAAPDASAFPSVVPATGAAVVVVDPALVAGTIDLRLRHFQKSQDAAGCQETAEMWERFVMQNSAPQVNTQPPPSAHARAARLYLAAGTRAVAAEVLRQQPAADANRRANEQADRAMA